MSSTAVAMVASLLGLLISCCTLVSSTVVVVNEKFFDFTFLDFLLIPGWGKSKNEGTFENLCTKEPCPTIPPSTNQTETDTKWSFSPPFPEYCKDGARIACYTESGKNKDMCTGAYKKKCVAAGGSWK